MAELSDESDPESVSISSSDASGDESSNGPGKGLFGLLQSAEVKHIVNVERDPDYDLPEELRNYGMVRGAEGGGADKDDEQKSEDNASEVRSDGSEKGDTEQKLKSRVKEGECDTQLVKEILSRLYRNELRTLNLVHKNLGLSDMRIVRNIFKMNKSAVALCLAHNPKLGIDGARLAFNALGPRRGAQICVALDLSGVSIDDEAADVVANGLDGRGFRLRHLTLGYNNIGDKGASSIAKAVGRHKVLEGIRLNCNRIGDEGAKALAQGIRESGRCETLDLNRNVLTDVGALEMAGLISNPDDNVLRRLLLVGNNISDEGAHAIATALEMVVNREAEDRIMILQLSGNRYSDEARTRLKAVAASIRQAHREIEEHGMGFAIRA